MLYDSPGAISVFPQAGAPTWFLNDFTIIIMKAFNHSYMEVQFHAFDCVSLSLCYEKKASESIEGNLLWKGEKRPNRNEGKLRRYGTLLWGGRFLCSYSGVLSDG